MTVITSICIVFFLHVQGISQLERDTIKEQTDHKHDSLVGKGMVIYEGLKESTKGGEGRHKEDKQQGGESLQSSRAGDSMPIQPQEKVRMLN